MSSYEEMNDFYRSEMGLPPAPLVYTGDEWQEMDDDGRESAMIAMERDMVRRADWYESRARELDPHDSGDAEEIKDLLFIAHRLRRDAERSDV